MEISRIIERVAEDERGFALLMWKEAEMARRRLRSGKLRKGETAADAELLAAKLTEVVVSMARSDRISEEAEAEALRKVFEGLSPKQAAIADRLIEQAARLRVQLDELAEDIRVNGKTEMFRQSERVEAYSRERPETALYVKLQKNLFGVLGQLREMLPAEGVDAGDDPLAAFLKDDG